MKITGRNIKRRLYGLRNLGSNIKRARHFRGHGVHSPFVYSVVRQVFMPSTFIGEKRDLYEALTARDVAQRRARELQNLMEHCHYESFGIDSAINQFEQYDIIIATCHNGLYACSVATIFYIMSTQQMCGRYYDGTQLV